MYKYERVCDSKTIFSPHLLNASESLSDINLAHSPPPSEDTKAIQLHPRSLVEKARMNVGWLDSSLSITLSRHTVILIQIHFFQILMQQHLENKWHL